MQLPRDSNKPEALDISMIIVSAPVPVVLYIKYHLLP